MKTINNIRLMILFIIFIFMITGCGPPTHSFNSSNVCSSDVSEINNIVRIDTPPKIDGQHNTDMNYIRDESGSMEKIFK